VSRFLVLFPLLLVCACGTPAQADHLATPRTAYCFTVAAFNAAGDSPSAEVCSTTLRRSSSTKGDIPKESLPGVVIGGAIIFMVWMMLVGLLAKVAPQR
jgi:hypothetical protein